MAHAVAVAAVAKVSMPYRDSNRESSTVFWRIDLSVSDHERHV